MTIQQALGLGAAVVGAVNAYLIGADTANDIPHVYMLALGGVNVALGAASVFFGNTVNMARTLLNKVGVGVPLSSVAKQ